MMTLFTGQPGAGKTSALVDLISKLSGDRPIFVHYDPAAKRRPDQAVLHETLTIPHQPIHANDWPGQLPDDAILIIDEVQDVWRPRASGAKVPDAIAALETHRHSGIDFYLTTQAPRLVDANVRGLVGRHIHLRDTGWLGRHWYEWPECNDGLAWKTCPVKRKFKLPKRVFDLYKSAVSHHETKRTIPMAYYLALASFVGLGVLAFLAYRVVNKPDAPVAAPVATPTATASSLQNFGAPEKARTIDDRVDFIPVFSSKPESAPAYQHLRVIVSMPLVVGGYCEGDVCRCITQQGTDPGISQKECRDWIKSPPFNPYLVKPEPDRRQEQRQVNPTETASL